MGSQPCCSWVSTQRPQGFSVTPLEFSSSLLRCDPINTTYRLKTQEAGFSRTESSLMTCVPFMSILGGPGWTQVEKGGGWPWAGGMLCLCGMPGLLVAETHSQRPHPVPHSPGSCRTGGNPEGVLDSWLPVGTGSAIAAIWESETVEARSMFVCPSIDPGPGSPGHREAHTGPGLSQPSSGSWQGPSSP